MYDADLSTAVDMITVTHDELSENRNQEAHFSKVWTDAMSLCQSCSIDCSASNNTAAHQQASAEQSV